MSDAYHAFQGTRHLASGALADVLTVCHPLRNEPQVLIFDGSGRQTDFDWSGDLVDVIKRAAPEAAPRTGPGRPKLGVRSVEVTLLPRHWDWLERQPARASGTLRRLVEDAMARESADPRKRAEALGRMLWAVAGNEPGFEEASRALYAGETARLEGITAAWPGLADFVRDFMRPSG
jgi:hypothetical protein